MSYLKVVIGPMFSGKSTYLVNEINRLEVLDKNVLVINHVLDRKRHSDLQADGGIVTHAGLEKVQGNQSLTYRMLNNLCELFEDGFRDVYRRADVVIIDESQFFPDLIEFIVPQLKSGKWFIVAGLSGSCEQRRIGNILDLIAIADDVVFLKSYCMVCRNGESAPFTKRKVGSGGKEFLVGKDDIYMAVCRKHLDQQ